MFITNPFVGAFGLDIGDVSLKLVQLKRHRSFRHGPYFTVQEVRTMNLPAGYIVNGTIEQPEMVRKKLLYLLGKEGRNRPLNVPWVVADLPEPQSFLKMMEIDIPAAELTADDIKFHAKKHLPLDLDEYYLDWQLLPAASHPSKRSRVLVAAAPKTLADTYTYLLESVGLNPLILETESFSIARSLMPSNEELGEPNGQIIVDLGATRTSFMVYDYGIVQFTSASTISGEQLTNSIAETLKIDVAAAETMKLRNGLIYDKKYPRYLKVITEFMENICAEIKKIAQFYKEHFPDGRPITKILLIGGGAHMTKLDETISRQLKISTRFGSPWTAIAKNTPGNEQISHGEEFCSAIGLAMRASENLLDD